MSGPPIRFRAIAYRLLACLLGSIVTFPAVGNTLEIPKRRRLFEERKENVYLIVPAVASLPGIGLFVGGLGTFSNIYGTGVDAGVTVAESIEGSDISVKAFALREIPLLIPGLTLDYQIADIKFGNFTTFLPGRNSPNFTIPVTGEFNIKVLAPSWRLFQRRFNITYRLAFFEGFSIDQSGREVAQASHAASASLLLDFTDDFIDPRSGFRFGYDLSLRPPESSILGRNSGPVDLLEQDENIKLENYLLTFYFPWSKRFTFVWNTRYFAATGNEESGEVVSGGSIPLRGYPGNRFRDRFGVFMGFEGRYTITLNRKIDFILAKGVLEGIQLAFFYEIGQVNPTRSSDLYGDLRRSYGLGIRALLDAIVLRLDLATSDEGPQFHLTISQPF